MESQVSYVMFKAGISLFLKKKVAYVRVKSNAVRNILLGTWVLVSVQLTRREFRLCMPLEWWSLDITLFVWL
jgi:hypothetical protein